MFEQIFAAGIGMALMAAFMDRLSRRGQIITGGVCILSGIVTVAGVTYLMVH